MKNYGLTKPLAGEFEAVRDRTEAALKQEGFGILTVVDIGETLRSKLGVSVGRYLILGACHPPSAYKAIQADKSIGLFLPCNVILYEQDSATTVVSMFDPVSVAGEGGNRELLEAAKYVRDKFQAILASL